jgi:polyhydroxyalkanoate synthase
LNGDWTNADQSPEQNVAALLKNWLSPVIDQLPSPLTPEDATALQEAIAHAAFDRTSAFMKGVRAYHTHATTRADDDTVRLVWRVGTTSLLDYAPECPEAPLVFVVPSLINRFDILDLAPDHSFLRALARAGFRPVVVDWDAPGEAEKDFTLTDYVERRLLPAFDFLTAEGRPCLTLGYCMGGLLTLALAERRPQATRALLLMATPWDMTPGGDAARAMLAIAEQVEPWLDRLGYLPVPILQALFASFQPAHVLKKYLRFAELDPASTEARLFVLTEDWLNDGVPLTAPVARECLRDWYGENRPGKGEWKIGDRLVDPRQITCPTYVLVPGLDRIVTPESAKPLAALLPNATLAEPLLGHIGLLASRKAPKLVWEPMIAWMKARTAENEGISNQHIETII